MRRFKFSPIAVLSIAVSFVCFTSSRPCSAQNAPTQPAATNAGDDAKAADEGGDDAAKPHSRVIELPNEENIESPPEGSKFDAAAAVNKAVNKLGYEKFERLASVEFVRRTWHWRDGKQSSYDSSKSYTNIRTPLVGMVQTLSNYENNRYIYFAAKVNGDDAFLQREKEVLSQPGHEVIARDYVAHEMVVAFLPFYVKLTNAPLHYAGVSTIQSFVPQSLDEEKGWIDYQPTTKSYDLVRAKMGAPYSNVTGAAIDLYFDRDTGDLAMIGAKDVYQELTGHNRLLLEYLESEVVDGITVPRRIRYQVDFSGYRIQHADLSDFVFHDKTVPTDLLKRP